MRRAWTVASRGAPIAGARRHLSGTPHVNRMPDLIGMGRVDTGEFDGPITLHPHEKNKDTPMSQAQRDAIKAMPHVQEHENDKASMVMVHMPGQEIVMGSYHPCGALFESTISLNRAWDCVSRLRAMLQKYDVPVYTVGEVLRMGHYNEDRLRLREFASRSVTYEVENGRNHDLIGEELRLVSDQYKDHVVTGLDVRDLVDMVVTRPTVTLAKSGNNLPLATKGYKFQPLSNLVFTRDQMIVTARGAVLANLNSHQRAPEVDVVKFCLQKLGIKVVGQLEAPGTLEGGDFYPAGRDLCFIGMGIRTNDAAIQYLMKKDWFGTARVAVVADLFDRNQSRMHLDCVANIASDNCFVVRESILGRDNPKRRLVTEYTRDATGKYQVTVASMEFGEYLQRNGWHIIPASEQIAEGLGINFMNIGNGVLLCPNKEMAEVIEAFPHFTGTVHYIDYTEICKMYGAIHCSTQAFRFPRDPAQAAIDVSVADGDGTIDTTSQEVDTLASLQTRIERSTPLPVAHSTNEVLLVCPTQFGQNTEATVDNEFMAREGPCSHMTDIDVVTAAVEEFEGLYTALQRNGVTVNLYHHELYHGTPDAVFPNNWFSTHRNNDGAYDLVLYPMAHPSRRRERRPDVIKFLTSLGGQEPARVVDLTSFEGDGVYLEGTGSMVLDRIHRVAYACLSSRTDEALFRRFCDDLGYQPCHFRTKGNMYHTNVMMSIGTGYAVVCFDHIATEEEAAALGKVLQQTGKRIVPISAAQCTDMCGNVLELRDSKDELFLAMSDRAYRAFSPQQLYTLLQTVDHIEHPEYKVIETLGGGSVRCSIAEIF